MPTMEIGHEANLSQGHIKTHKTSRLSPHFFLPPITVSTRHLLYFFIFLIPSPKMPSLAFRSRRLVPLVRTTLPEGPQATAVTTTSVFCPCLFGISHTIPFL